VAEARALYSALEEDREIVDCFLVLQELREFPRKKQKPVTDLLESTQVAQSASLKPSSYKGEFLEKRDLFQDSFSNNAALTLPLDNEPELA
jgi:hypothetical protein